MRKVAVTRAPTAAPRRLDERSNGFGVLKASHRRLPLPLRLILLVTLVTPILAWFLVKPLRVVAPLWQGVACADSGVCVDDPGRSAEAALLYQEARRFVSGRLAPLGGTPRVVFCSTDLCADSFGLGARSAVTVGTWGTVIGPRAWKAYYVRHELIHRLQAEKLGTLPLLLKPGWFVEGMAYALSEDPRPLLVEPFESQRQRFRAWLATIDPAVLWTEAEKL
jgi:hypothetical protein